MLAVLVAFFGAGEGFYGPALGAIVPELRPRRACSCRPTRWSTSLRPLRARLAGPALGGVARRAAGHGRRASGRRGTFAISIACLLAMRVREPPDARASPAAARAGPRGPRASCAAQTWLWATLHGRRRVSLLFFLGPAEVLVPYLVKNDSATPARGRSASSSPRAGARLRRSARCGWAAAACRAGR